MKLLDIKQNPDNPRVIKDESFEKLCNSIKEFPKMMKLRPLVLDMQNVVIGGNRRLKALQHLGYKEIPDEWVKFADELTEEEIRRFIIADNVSNGEWDWDILANKWDIERLDEWGLNMPFIDEKTKDSLFNNSNCEYPLIPLYDEKYTAFVIICETATEEASIRTKFDFPYKAKSYKNSFLGETNVLRAKDIL